MARLAASTGAVQERMQVRGFNSKTEYVRALTRADVERARTALKTKLVSRDAARGR